MTPSRARARTMSRVSRNARGGGIRAPRGGGFQMGRLYMVSGWAGMDPEKLAAAGVLAAAGRGSGGAEREEKEERRRKRAETAKPPRTAP
uniref:Uncharacterized protein n=1 Tax=Arundo donax TaxID=35708 RepID=A0A0A9HE36_ARUDO